MFDKKFIVDAVNRSSETEVDRRALFTMAGLAGAGVATAAVVGGAQAANADTPTTESPADVAVDEAVLNFALNLEYLEAEFYLKAVHGHGLPDNMTHGKGGAPGAVHGGRKVHFKTPAIRKYAAEIAGDEYNHVAFLRKALGTSAVARPAISLDASFTAAATAAGVIKAGEKFDPYKDELHFLFGAFLFEDVGVTAYKGAAQFITNKVFLEAAAGILAVEAYHAGIVRNTLFEFGVTTPSVYGTVAKLSAARDSLDGTSDDDQGIKGNSSRSNLVPTDKNSIAYSRTPGTVLNIVFLNDKAVKSGGFFPKGIHGVFTESADSVGS